MLGKGFQAGEMAWPIKCLPCKQEDPQFTSQDPCNKLGMMAHVSNPSAREAKTSRFWEVLASQPRIYLVGDPLSEYQNKIDGVLKKMI